MTGTRNQRLAAISSFSTWMQTEDPARMACWQDILAIPAKKQARPALSHLTAGQARRLLAQPDRSTRQGRRDATLLATLYDTGARVQELADLAVRDIRLQNPAMASLTGKGHKTRHVPLAGNTITLLAAYLAEHRLDEPGHDDHPVFYGQHQARLSRGGIAWIIRKYQAQIHDPQLAGPASARTSCVIARLSVLGFRPEARLNPGVAASCLMSIRYSVRYVLQGRYQGLPLFDAAFDLTWLTCLSSENWHLPGTLRSPVQISTEMHLYEAGVPLPYIRDILGHVDLSTTEIYARASTEAKRKALEAAYPGIVTSDLPEWNQDPGLLEWLTIL